MTSGELHISHLPLLLEERAHKKFLIGHLALANPHARHLDKHKVTAVFNGPNAPIHPKWYAENDVPTWNYAAVHVSGYCTLIRDKKGIQTCLEKLATAVELFDGTSWPFWLPDDLKDFEKMIVGFEIEIETIDAKFKLSQNRSESDFLSVQKGLQQRAKGQDVEVSQLMKSLKNE